MKMTSVVSWLIILVIALGVPILRVVGDDSATMRPADSKEPIDLQFTMAAKYLYGAGRLDSRSQASVMRRADHRGAAFPRRVRLTFARQRWCRPFGAHQRVHLCGDTPARLGGDSGTDGHRRDLRDHSAVARFVGPVDHRARAQ